MGNEEDSATQSILEKYHTIAIVGLSKETAKDSYKVAEYLKNQGYHIIPVNPSAEEILGEKCYKSLLDMPESVQKSIEVVNIFRPSADVPPIVDQAIWLRKRYRKPYGIWMQLGIIISEDAAKKARKAGLAVIMDKCMMIEHKRFMREGEKELEEIRKRKVRELAKRIGEGEKLNKPIILEDSTFDRLVQQHPLIVVDCWAAWCGPCHVIAPIIDELAEKYGGKVTFGKLNVDENPKTAMRFNVLGIPTLLIMKNGEEVDRIVGAVPKQHIEAKLDKQIKE